MTSKLAIIKDLRDRGASIKMMDDVASHVGSYDHPVFVATVDLIIKLKDLTLEAIRDHQQAMGLGDAGEEKGDDKTAQADYNVARTVIQNDDEVSEDVRKKMLEHLAAIENQKDSQIEARKGAESFIGDGSDEDLNKKKRRKESKPKESIWEKLSKLAQQQASQRQQQQRREQQDELRDAAQKSSQNAQRQQQQQVQQVVKGSMLKLSSMMKMRLLSSLKVTKDRSIYGDEQWRQSQKTSTLGTNHKESKTTKDPEKTTQELISSKSIDQILKDDKAKNNVPLENAEKGKFQQQVGEKSAPKANEAEVAKMAAKEAIEKLQNSGMRTTGDDAAKMKAEMDKLAQQQAQQQQQQKQR